MRCAWCSRVFAGRADARFCSGRCRVASHRADVPLEMRRLRRWLRHEAKRPISVTGGPASSTNSHTWSSFERANSARIGDGLGFALGDGVACIDLDHCLSDGVLADWAAPIVAACQGTYIEVSPSGEGLHIFGFAVVGRGRRRAGVEVYDRGRYMTVTKRRFRRAPLVLRDISAVVAGL